MATTTTEQIMREAPFLEDYRRKLLESAYQLTKPPVTLPGQQVAPFSADQLASLGLGRQGIGAFAPYLTGARDELGAAGAVTAGQLPGIAQAMGTLGAAPGIAAGAMAPGTAAGIEPYMDPYSDLVTQKALEQMQRQAQMQQNQLAASAVGQGAFGGGRYGVAEAELGRGLQDVMSQRIAEDRARNFGMARQAFEGQQQRQLGVGQLLGQLGVQQAGAAGAYGTAGGQLAGLAGQRAGLGQLAQGLGQADVQMLSQMGGLQQQQAQRGLDIAQQNQLQQLYEPYQRTGFFGDILRGTPSVQQTLATQTAPSPSFLSQALGAGITAAGIFGPGGGGPMGLGGGYLFGNPWGAGLAQAGLGN